MSVKLLINWATIVNKSCARRFICTVLTNPEKEFWATHAFYSISILLIKEIKFREVEGSVLISCLVPKNSTIELKFEPKVSVSKHQPHQLWYMSFTKTTFVSSSSYPLTQSPTAKQADCRWLSSLLSPVSSWHIQQVLLVYSQALGIIALAFIPLYIFFKTIRFTHL